MLDMLYLHLERLHQYFIQKMILSIGSITYFIIVNTNAEKQIKSNVNP